MNIDDFLNSSDSINDDMDDMDMDITMNNYENSDLMTSDFFNSILPFEDRPNNSDDILNFDDDLNIFNNNIHIDDVLSPKSYSSESEPISDQTSVSSLENVDDLSSKLNNTYALDDQILISLLNPSINENKKNKNLSSIKIPSHHHQQQQQVKATKILIQNPSNKKCITKPIINATQWKKSGANGTKSQILRVQKVSNNGRSVLLPLSVQNLKFLNASTINTNIKKRQNIETTRRSIPSDDDTDTVSSSTNNNNNNNLYQPLCLTNEEKRLLTKEGITLPTHHPLTKNEERELKRIRRKIRNKISAQDSRKRKKEYVDGLEERVKKGSEENKNLIQRVKELQRENKTLIAHVNKLQAIIRNSTSTKANPSTCLMVVLLSALLVSLPNLKLLENQGQNGGDTNEAEALSNIRRSLLSSQQVADEDLNMDEFLVFKDGATSVDVGIDGLEKLRSKYEGDIENHTLKGFNKMINHLNQQNIDRYHESQKKQEINSVLKHLFEQLTNLLQRDKNDILETKPPDIGQKHGFIEPDIDDYLPTAPTAIKKRKLNDLYMNDELVTSSTTVSVSENK